MLRVIGSVLQSFLIQTCAGKFRKKLFWPAFREHHCEHHCSIYALDPPQSLTEKSELYDLLFETIFPRNWLPTINRPPGSCALRSQKCDSPNIIPSIRFIAAMAQLPVNLQEILSVFATLKVNLQAQDSSCLVDKVDENAELQKTPKLGKHLKLLNCIALLLVTEATSDGSAVTLTNSPGAGKIKTVIHFVKNRESSDQEKSYYTKFMETINTADKQALPLELINLILDNCRPKIIKRVTKVEQAIQERKKLGLSPKDPDESTRKAIDDFRKWYQLESAKDKPWPDFLDHWLESTLKPKYFAQGNGLSAGHKILWEVHEFTKSDDLLRALQSPKLGRRLKKLATYYQALRVIVRYVRLHRDKRSFELNIVRVAETSFARGNTNLVLKLQPPPRTNLPPIDSPLSLVNRSGAAMRTPLDPFTLEDLKSIAPGVRETDITGGRREGEAFVHCECALAVMMRDRVPGTLEIGVSKDCCWPCLEFLGRYSNIPGKIVVSATHGKTYHSWLFPPNAPPEISRKMEERARREFVHWFLALNGRRRSYSHAESSDSEHQRDSEEEDELKLLARSLPEFL